MRTIMHISDLHFGRVDPEARDALSSDVHAFRPDVLAVSGDLTQRARVEQFREFMKFVEPFPMPKIIVPGNHDIPLFDVLRRFFAPLHRFRKWVEPKLDPVFEDDEVCVIGANTAHSWTISGGTFSEETILALESRLRAVASNKLRVLVCHHPLHTHPNGREGWIGGLEKITERIDFVLTGHLHLSANEVLTHREGMPIVLLRGGTAISTRQRGESNSYHLLRVEKDAVDVELRIWDEIEKNFKPHSSRRFNRYQQEFTEKTSF